MLHVQMATASWLKQSEARLVFIGRTLQKAGFRVIKEPGVSDFDPMQLYSLFRVRIQCSSRSLPLKVQSFFAPPRLGGKVSWIQLQRAQSAS